MEMAEFEELHACSVKACTSRPWEVKPMDDEYYITVCLFGHETIWERSDYESSETDL